MAGPIPPSVLFCCDHNAIRSPMAEGMMKKFYGRAAYVQSAGVRNDMEVDGFAIAVCKEIGVEISTHRSRVRVMIIPTDEEAMIVRHTLAVLDRMQKQ